MKKEEIMFGKTEKGSINKVTVVGQTLSLVSCCSLYSCKSPEWFQRWNIYSLQIVLF